ncbi:hypothetical protein [Agromyces binzhouensis]|uniref:Uncharacterized protein n=1 Tax=Agromyces binzhouensis TaxID=1817495 RepID=A0A4Q2JYJ1_9MICO|nr:hypothetical protein [Agromyces binzhouensis]RXZ51869.1 hypothetical protein ESO86_00525 [Agromyces binzhouensis]
MSGTPLHEFLASELNEHIRIELLTAIEQARSGCRYFTYNTFNVLVDADRSTATVEDELDDARASEINLRQFTELLAAWRQQD